MVLPILVLPILVLPILRSRLPLNGTMLVAAAAGIFGLAHLYQQAAGVVLTTLAGVLFCALYVATGSLLVPILLHVLVDARFALLPAPQSEDPRPAFA